MNIEEINDRIDYTKYVIDTHLSRQLKEAAHADIKEDIAHYSAMIAVCTQRLDRLYGLLSKGLHEKR